MDLSDDEFADEIPSVAEAKEVPDDELPQFAEQEPAGTKPKRRRLTALHALSIDGGLSRYDRQKKRTGGASVSLSPSKDVLSGRRASGARSAPPGFFKEEATRNLSCGLLHHSARPGASGSLPLAKNLVTKRFPGRTVRGESGELVLISISGTFS